MSLLSLLEMSMNICYIFKSRDILNTSVIRIDISNYFKLHEHCKFFRICKRWMKIKNQYSTKVILFTAKVTNFVSTTFSIYKFVNCFFTHILLAYINYKLVSNTNKIEYLRVYVPVGDLQTLSLSYSYQSWYRYTLDVEAVHLKAISLYDSNDSNMYQYQ